MAAAAINGDYVDLKFIKSRKVAQIVIEIPIEAANAFVQAFGTPSPAEGVPVGLARLQAAKAEPEVDKPRRKMNELPLPQQAGILCSDPDFAKYIAARHSPIYPRDPAEFLRTHCGVSTRADLKPGSPAAARFYEMQASFDVWRKYEKVA